MRTAESRVATTRAMDSAMEGARGVYERFSMPRGYMKAGAAVAVGLFGVWMVRRMLTIGSHKVMEVQGGTMPARNGTALLYLLIQVASALVLPWVRGRLKEAEWGDLVKKMHPSHLFFRWLGLEK